MANAKLAAAARVRDGWISDEYNLSNSGICQHLSSRETRGGNVPRDECPTSRETCGKDFNQNDDEPASSSFVRTRSVHDSEEELRSGDNGTPVEEDLPPTDSIDVR